MATDSIRSSSLQNADQMITSSSSDFAALAKSINFNIPVKLDRENYVYWKAQMLPTIEAFELDDFISAWNVLKCLYPQQSLAKVLQLKWQMQNVKKGSSSVSEFVLKVEGIGNALRGA
ncbi:hypothetical protein ACOSQ3_014086 [Xanthoceras sorbifolium]